MNEVKVRKPGRVKSAILGALAGWMGGPIGLRDGGFWSSWLGTTNFSGQPVTVNSTLQVSAAWACVRLISETLATLPMNLHRGHDEAKVVARDHQLYNLLHNQPNADMSAAVFWQAYIASMLLWGGAYAEKKYSRGVITSLEFLQPAFVVPMVSSSGLVAWRYNDPITRTTRVINEEAMWFTPAFSLDGYTGLSPIAMGANVFGGALAADEASAATFRNGMKASGLVTMDAILKPEQRDQVRAHIKQVNEEGGYFVLEKGTGFQALTMNPQDAELLQTRAFNVEEVCRWFLVPPHMVSHGEKSSNWGTGLEQQTTGFVRFVLRPWAVRIEQSVRKCLLTPAERLTYSAEFALEGLMRGDSAARAAFYGVMVDKGIMTRDECRRLENLPLMGGNAAELTVQAQMVPIDRIGELQAGSAPPPRDTP